MTQISFLPPPEAAPNLLWVWRFRTGSGTERSLELWYFLPRKQFAV